MNLTKTAEDVYVAGGEFVQLDHQAMEFIREQARRSARGRSRICCHKHPGDPLHEMYIAIRSDSYVRPHRHLNKAESFHLVEGEADILLFDDEGRITDLIELGKDQSAYFRLDTPRFHTILVRTSDLIVHEVTSGPFNPAQTQYLPSSPPEGGADVPDYVSWLRKEAEAWKNGA